MHFLVNVEIFASPKFVNSILLEFFDSSVFGVNYFAPASRLANFEWNFLLHIIFIFFYR